VQIPDFDYGKKTSSEPRESRESRESHGREGRGHSSGGGSGRTASSARVVSPQADAPVEHGRRPKRADADRRSRRRM